MARSATIPAMLRRLFTQQLVRPQDLTPSGEHMKVVGTLNPGAADFPPTAAASVSASANVNVNAAEPTDGRGVVLLVRVCEQLVETREGSLPSPRHQPGQGFVADWLDAADVDPSDPRNYWNTRDGSLRLQFISYLKVLHSPDGKHIPPESIQGGPVIMPEGEYEEFGIEDPRITRIDATYYITYVAVSRHGAVTRLMSTTDFKTFRRHGPMFPPDNKDVVLFPQRVLGDYLAIHRPMTAMPFSPYQMWLARSPDLTHWGGHEQLMGPGSQAQFQNRIGGGCPPIRTREGWLHIYHGSDKAPGDRGAGTYSAAAVLLDSQNPKRILARTPEPFMSPEADFETSGFVPNVIFPTGLVERGDEIWLYYGAADESVGVVGYERKALMEALQPVSA